MFTLESEEMTALWPNDKLTFAFSKSMPKWTSFVKLFLNLMLCLESDKMTALWPYQNYTFTFYSKFSDKIPNWATFVREVLWFDA